MAQRLLIVDDDPDVLKAAAATLARAVEAVDTAVGPDGLAERAHLYDAVLLDMNFAAGARDGAEGLDTLDRLQAADPALSVVLMTTYGGVALAVQALKRGAADFVLKPWRNEALIAAMQAAAALTAERRASGKALNLDDLERRAIERALSLYEGNVSHAAQALGLTRPALYRRMERHGL
ncbi:MAG TPA: response regulator [Phenylobacterium sp.]|jgi:DNA-binding NtrC family response regulator|uniref:response regulator n=1 Tax=Phenylobacterium sp. TaxID=1871053 RepID=UPI002D267843|nr:response regulator [Phenylobacterium sp.]HZZ67769.1 response regulator [Phenylobacterium sp.]